MTTTKNIAIAAVLFAVANAGAAQAADSPSLTMKPMQGISFSAGSEHTVSYFQSEKGRCKLVVTSAGAPDWNNDGRFTATRFEAAVRAGKATRYTSAEGKAFDYTCADDTRVMHVKQVEHLSAAAE